MRVKLQFKGNLLFINRQKFDYSIQRGIIDKQNKL